MKAALMLCCTLIAAIASLLLRPMLIRGSTPALAWRLGPNPPQATSMSVPRRTTRWRSFGFAVAGLRFAIGQEPNMRIHVGTAVAAVLAGALLHISAQEWCMLVLAMAVVLAAEALNTAVEQTCNALGGDFNREVGHAKDVAAGAVLICAGAAAIVGAIIFIPHLWPHDTALGLPTARLCGGRV
jgi:diacylglycerol kinase (ATP)